MLTVLTGFHVLISLVGILSGLVVVLGMIGRRRSDYWGPVFLVTTAATSITGFLFPIHGLMASLRFRVVAAEQGI